MVIPAFSSSSMNNVSFHKSNYALMLFQQPATASQEWLEHNCLNLGQCSLDC